MGGLAGGWEDADTVIRTMAEEAVQNAADLLTRRNPGWYISTKVVEGSPKHAIF
jgi:hypothetical protein